MRIDTYIDKRTLPGVSGLFSAITSVGSVDGSTEYTRTERDGKTVFEYALNGARLYSEFTEKANGVVIRRDYFENLTDAPICIYHIASRFCMDGNEYDVYTQYNAWQHESRGEWQHLVTQITTGTSTIFTCDGAAPIMALHNRYTGKNTVFHLLPNCKWHMTATKFPVNKKEQTVLEMGISDPALNLEVMPGECIDLPAIIFFEAENKTDLDAYKLHEVYNEMYPRCTTPILYNSWLYCFDKLDVDKLLLQVDAAAELGFEAFMIDAGWFGDGGVWIHSVGDWTENPVSGPAGRMIEIAERVKEKGMVFGLWFEPERAGKYSKAIKEHPELFFSGQFLDFANPAAVDYILDAVSSQIEKYNIGWLKFDFNVATVADPKRTAFYRYMKGQFDFIRRLREKYPHLYITNCAGGGYRMELMQSTMFDSYWFTDNQGPYEGLRIIKDTLKRMPTSLIERWTVQKYVEGIPEFDHGAEGVGRMIHTNNADWTFLIGIDDSYSEAFAKGGPIGFSCDVAAFPDEYKQRWGKLIAEYKTEREFYKSANARILVDGEDITAIQYSDANLDKCVVQLFTKNIYTNELIIYPVVDASAQYTLDGATLSGADIKAHGILVSTLADNSARTIVLTRA